MPPFTPSQPPSRRKGPSGTNARGRTLLLAAVCASLTPSTSAFAVGPVSGPASLARSSSSAMSSSSDDDAYFFTAPTQPSDDDADDDVETKTMTPNDGGIISAEQTELENLAIATEEEEDLLSTAAAVSSSLSTTTTPSPAPAPALTMDVDGNGTGALMKRSPASGGIDAPLAATNPYLAFPIDSGKEGMQALDTRVRTRKSASDEIVDRAQPGTRLVRYNLPCSDALEESKQESMPRKLVLGPSKKNGTSGKLAMPVSQTQEVGPPKPRLVRYNGPDVADSTDYDGMELPSVKKRRNRTLKINRSNLVRYEGASQQKHLEKAASDDVSKSGTEEDHKKGRKTLVEDVGYANRYTGLTDWNLARKTGLTVNKPISLWVERDKFL